MTTLVQKFNNIAATVSVSLEVFQEDKGYPILLASNEITNDSPRFILYIIMGQQSMGRIFMPKEVTSTFSVADIWEINSNTVKYELYVRRMPTNHNNFVFQIERVS
jgi:hypothetical protein